MIHSKPKPARLKPTNLFQSGMDIQVIINLSGKSTKIFLVCMYLMNICDAETHMPIVHSTDMVVLRKMSQILIYKKGA